MCLSVPGVYSANEPCGLLATRLSAQVAQVIELYYSIRSRFVEGRAGQSAHELPVVLI